MSAVDGVGYRRPPKHTRFKKGHSGNPRGRPRKRRTLQDEILTFLDEKIEIRADGRVRRVARRVVIAMQVINGAMKGDARAAKYINELDRVASEHDGRTERDVLGQHDLEILKAYAPHILKRTQKGG